jgi:hypothetical protein
MKKLAAKAAKLSLQSMVQNTIKKLAGEAEEP